MQGKLLPTLCSAFILCITFPHAHPSWKGMKPLKGMWGRGYARVAGWQGRIILPNFFLKGRCGSLNKPNLLIPVCVISLASMKVLNITACLGVYCDQTNATTSFRILIEHIWNEVWSCETSAYKQDISHLRFKVNI